MKESNNQILFDKYQVIRALGSGSFSKVLLVRHLSLEQDRAIKIIPHSSKESFSPIKEALLLKSLNHPGIPRIYDIEQDELNFYLVEEYIQGESLDIFLQKQQNISQGLFFNICTKLCDIFIYLHTLAPSPIIYGDIKPEHIIVCGNHIKLIDFGISTIVSKSGNTSKTFGNLAFSAPETISGQSITISSDIYGIGKILDYLIQYVYPKPSQNIKHIIHKSIESDPANRFETVEKLKSELNNEFLKKCQPHLSKKIAVIGSHHGCGTTHIAISIVSTLNSMGQSSFYIERSKSDSLLEFANVTNKFKEHNGIYFCHNFIGIPEYGPGINIPVPDDAITVYDLGHYCNEMILSNFDVVILVCGGAFGHLKDLDKLIKQLETTRQPYQIICNLCNKKQSAIYAGFLDKKIFSYPFDADPMRPDNSSKRLITRLLSKKGWLSFFEKNYRKSFFQRP